MNGNDNDNERGRRGEERKREGDEDRREVDEDMRGEGEGGEKGEEKRRGE